MIGKFIYSIDVYIDIVDFLVISFDGKILISGSWDDFVKFWNFSDGNLICSINFNFDDIKVVVIVFDGDILVIGSYRGFIKLWSLKIGIEILYF